jgi:hypothetical protein
MKQHGKDRGDPTRYNDADQPVESLIDLVKAAFLLVEARNRHSLERFESTTDL